MRLEKTTVLDGYYLTAYEDCGEFWGKTNDDLTAVYPFALAPEGTQGKRGRWTITIVFESDKAEKP